MRVAWASVAVVVSLAGCQHATSDQPTVASKVADLTAEEFLARVSREKVCLRGLDARVREHDEGWCVSYSVKTEPGQFVIGPEGIICLNKRTGQYEDTIFHASPPACPVVDAINARREKP